MRADGLADIVAAALSSISNPSDEFLAGALPERHGWAQRPAASDLAPLPNVPAIYLLEDAGGAPIQLATTQALRRLLTGRLAAEAPAAGRADLAAIARGVRWRGLGTAFEGRWWYYRLARRLYPGKYREMIGFGAAWFLRVDFAQAIPEIRVTDRFALGPGECIGPWPTHAAAQEALTGLWDLFDLCRYPQEVRRAPQGTRCAYAEMGRCDAPCDGSVPLGPYIGRCRAAWSFAREGPDAWIGEAEADMRSAAAALAFELAAQRKQQLVFARRWREHWWSVVRAAEAFHDAAALPVARRKAWKLLLFRAGEIVDGPIVTDRKLAVAAPEWFGSAAQTESAVDATERAEQAWLWSHLMFSRERASAIVHALRGGAPGPDFARTWAELVEARKPRAVEDSAE